LCWTNCAGQSRFWYVSSYQLATFLLDSLIRGLLKNVNEMSLWLDSLAHSSDFFSLRPFRKRTGLLGYDNFGQNLNVFRHKEVVGGLVQI